MVATQRAGFVIRVPVFAGPGRVLADQPAASRFLGSVAVTLRIADLMAQLGRESRLQGLYVAMSDMGSSLLPDQSGGKAVPLAPGETQTVGLVAPLGPLGPTAAPSAPSAPAITPPRGVAPGVPPAVPVKLASTEWAPVVVIL